MADGNTFKTDPAALCGDTLKADPRTFGDIDWKDHKVAFVAPYIQGKDVLDLGCVEHDHENHRSRFWLHRALRERAGAVLGMDLYPEGVNRLRALGYDIVVGDAQAFELGRAFDVIVAGDVVNHLEDHHGFLASCRRHLRPGGKILISMPNPWYWRTVARAALTKDVCGNREQTNWLCVRTLDQLAKRHGMGVKRVAFGSRYLRDRLMPLPRGWKHTSIHAEIAPT